MNIYHSTKLRLLIILMLTACIASPQACVPIIYSFRQLKRHSRAIYVGTVVEKELIKTENYRDHYRVKFVVEQRWKNANGKELTIVSEMHDCAFRFEVGQKYLVYAYYEKENDWLTTLHASQITSAQKDLIKLGKGK